MNQTLKGFTMRYKILKNITWCGKTYLEGMFYDFHEAPRPETIQALIAKGLIEQVPEPKQAPAPEKPKASKTETRFKKGK
jgi:hypothetical protein